MVSGSGNQGSTKPLLKQKQRLSGTENQPAMVKDAWTGWGDHSAAKRLESTHCTYIVRVVARVGVDLVALGEVLQPGVDAIVLRRRTVAFVGK